jgi:elongation factor 1-alpha
MPLANSEKEHLSIVICGHVDSGKSTTTGRLLFELGGIPERELEKLKQEAERLGKASFAFAFYMDRQKEERERGVTISCTTKEFFTDKWHYTIIDAPGHRDFIKNMISGAAQADVCLLMVPADGNFTTAIQRGNHKAGEVQGQTRQHARLLNLLGVKQLIVGINKMDTDVAKYSEERYVEIRDEMRNMLTKVGWKKDFVAKSVPVLPISGWMGDNLLKKSEKMGWWSGVDIETEKNGKVHVHTLKDALNDMVDVPQRETNKPLRLPISGIYKIKGVGDVLAGRVEQGLAKPGEECVFLPTHTSSNPCVGKVFTVEMHHKRVDQAKPGDNVGMNIKGLDKGNMPRVGDVMILKSDPSLKLVKDFTAQIQSEADTLGKSSFAFAFFMDRQKEERERGVTISCTTKEFFTEKWHYTIIDAPGHRDFIKNMISGAAQADVCLHGGEQGAPLHRHLRPRRLRQVDDDRPPPLRARRYPRA